MSGTSKEQKEKEHLRRRKEWARITEELEDNKWKMSSEFELELLRKRKELSEDIWLDLKEEERILQDDIRYWVADIEKMQRMIDRREFPDPSESSGEKEDEVGHKVYTYNSEEEEEEYPEEEEEEKESENSPQCAACLAQKSEEQNSEEEYSEEENSEEEESSRNYDDSE